MDYIKADWPAPAQIKAYTTTRHGWGGRYFQRDEVEGPADSVPLISLLKLPGEPIWVNQTHSAIVIEATPDNKEQIADATFTRQPDRVCVVSTADCLPLLICNKQGTQVAAIHAGWRGLAAGIIENTLKTFQQPGDELLVWLGPAIGPARFEVGKDVYTAFTLQHAESSDAFVPHTEGKWLASLYSLAKVRLNMQGISQVYGGNYCTHTQNDLFFSYRRDQGRTGRMASLIWIEGGILDKQNAYSDLF